MAENSTGEMQQTAMTGATARYADPLRDAQTEMQRESERTDGMATSSRGILEDDDFCECEYGD